jgi:N-methylhydantoinase A/oxoprolinase/acetone carboxylase beta subunit
MSLRVGIDVGGTNTDAVLIDANNTIISSVKRPTTDDIQSGIRDALQAVLEGHDRAAVKLAMLGTTQCTNAIVERRGLRRVGVLRVGAPATTSVPPLADWPADLRDVVLGDSRIVGGGHHFDGREIAALDEAAIRQAAKDWAGDIEAVAVTGVFSPVSTEHEQRAAELLAELLDVPISTSHDIGSVGLIERENATVMNAALTGIALRAARGFQLALAGTGVAAQAYLSQNDGTLMTLAQAERYPVLTVASGPTNSLRGGALLSSIADAVVIDVGGTTADLGVLAAGFPRESGVAMEIGGVRTNFRMPDLISVALGGGTVVRIDGDGVRVGPDSVGHRITSHALCFGGDTLTLTDIAIAAGFELGDVEAVRRSVDRRVADEVRAITERRLADALDRIKTNAEPVTVIAVGGGSFLVPDALEGALTVLRPPHHEVANAVGAAIAEVSGEVHRIYQLEGRSRAGVLEEAREEARAKAVSAGAAPGAVRDIDLEEVALAYLPGNAVRIRARAAGPLDASVRSGVAVVTDPEVS